MGLSYTNNTNDYSYATYVRLIYSLYSDASIISCRYMYVVNVEPVQSTGIEIS